MKIVIDIPEMAYETFKEWDKSGVASVEQTIIANGTPLHKGHGELIDKDIVIDMMNRGVLEEYITMIGGVIPADK